MWDSNTDQIRASPVMVDLGQGNTSIEVASMTQ